MEGQIVNFYAAAVEFILKMFFKKFFFKLLVCEKWGQQETRMKASTKFFDFKNYPKREESKIVPRPQSKKKTH